GFNIEACVATERVIRDVIQRLYRLSPPSSEPVAQVEELPEAPELPTSESQLLWESGVEQATLRQEEGGFEFAVDEGKEAEDVVLNELLEPRDESVEAPSQPQLHWLFSSQESQDPKSASDVAMEQGVYEINPEEVEVPPSFFQTDVESVGEEEPGVYEISEEVLEEPSEFLGHIKEPSISSIPPEFMAPSQRRSQPRAYGVTLQESRPPTSSPLTEEAPCLQKDAEDAGATFKSEPLQMGTQSEIIEADERVVIDFYFPPGEALPQEVAFEEVEPETSQGASHEEPQASVQYPKESPTMTTQPPVHFSEEPMQGGYRGTVMVVDDSPTVQKIVAITLEREGYRVVGVDNAMQALAKFEEFVPDVILLDINLPYIDGYQLCKIIKGNPLTKSASVIMLTGKDGFFDKVKGKLAGASEYITKPFQPNYLVETVRRHTSGRL
ncbi:MAG: response regulator, partial [Candidatus Caldarchaeum sp.]